MDKLYIVIASVTAAEDEITPVDLSSRSYFSVPQKVPVFVRLIAGTLRLGKIVLEGLWKQLKYNSSPYSYSVLRREF